MALASLPVWMEFVINDKYPTWRKVEHNPDGTARYMPAGVRLVENPCYGNSARKTSWFAIPTTSTNSLAPELALSASQPTTRWA